MALARGLPRGRSVEAVSTAYCRAAASASTSGLLAGAGMADYSRQVAELLVHGAAPATVRTHTRTPGR
jgi:hypothetical protein